MKKYLSVVLCGLVVLTQSMRASAEEGNASHGALLYIQKACITCHGANGRGGVPTSPIIGGQKYAYLVNALLDYQKGYRKNEIMQPVSALLSDSDIKDISAYLTSKTA